MLFHYQFFLLWLKELPIEKMMLSCQLSPLSRMFWVMWEKQLRHRLAHTHCEPAHSVLVNGQVLTVHYLMGRRQAGYREVAVVTTLSTVVIYMWIITSDILGLTPSHPLLLFMPGALCTQDFELWWLSVCRLISFHLPWEWWIKTSFHCCRLIFPWLLLYCIGATTPCTSCPTPRGTTATTPAPWSCQHFSASKTTAEAGTGTEPEWYCAVMECHRSGPELCQCGQLPSLRVPRGPECYCAFPMEEDRGGEGPSTTYGMHSYSVCVWQ